MAKQPRVWTGTQWDTLAVTLPDLSNYSTTTQMNTAIAASEGLTLLTTQNLSSVSTFSFTNFLSSTYDFYRLVISGYNSSRGNNLNMRARINTTDVTAGYYSVAWTAIYNGTTGYNASVNNGSTWTVFCNAGQSTDTGTTLDTIDLRVSSDNRLIYSGSGYDGFYGGAMVTAGTVAAQANPPTGFTIFTSSGTFTGTIALYGYRKA